MGPLTPRAIRHPVGPPSQSHIRDFSPKNLRAVYVSSRFMTVAWGVPDYPADVSSYVVYWKEVGAQRFVELPSFLDLSSGASVCI